MEGKIIMKRNGFTMVELLGVIVILGLIITIVVPTIGDSANKVREKTYLTKIDMIKKDAITYGQDNYGTIVKNNGNKINSTTYKVTMSLRDLIDKKYYVCDTDTVQKNGKNYCVVDPRDNDNYLDDLSVTITIVTKPRDITAEVS